MCRRLTNYTQIGNNRIPQIKLQKKTRRAMGRELDSSTSTDLKLLYILILTFDCFGEETNV
jgi:hypothetical protein